MEKVNYKIFAKIDVILYACQNSKIVKTIVTVKSFRRCGVGVGITSFLHIHFRKVIHRVIHRLHRLKTQVAVGFYKVIHTIHRPYYYKRPFLRTIFYSLSLAKNYKLMLGFASLLNGASPQAPLRGFRPLKP